MTHYNQVREALTHHQTPDIIYAWSDEKPSQSRTARILYSSQVKDARLGTTFVPYHAIEIPQTNADAIRIAVSNVYPGVKLVFPANGSLYASEFADLRKWWKAIDRWKSREQIAEACIAWAQTYGLDSLASAVHRNTETVKHAFKRIRDIYLLNELDVAGIDDTKAALDLRASFLAAPLNGTTTRALVGYSEQIDTARKELETADSLLGMMELLNFGGKHGRAFPFVSEPAPPAEAIQRDTIAEPAPEPAPDGPPDSRTLEVVTMLQEFVDVDPQAMRALLRTETPCSELLADHADSYVKVTEGAPELTSLTPLGLINAVLRKLGLTPIVVGYPRDAHPVRELAGPPVKFAPYSVGYRISEV